MPRTRRFELSLAKNEVRGVLALGAMVALGVACAPSTNRQAITPSSGESPQPVETDMPPQPAAESRAFDASKESVAVERNSRTSSERQASLIELGSVDGIRVSIELPLNACSESEEIEDIVVVMKSPKSVRRISLNILGPPSTCMDYNWRVETGDFNFDGKTDFSVPLDQSGPYGSTTHAVFLQSQQGGIFNRSKEMSDLTGEHMGLFSIDPERRELILYSKSGCCIHTVSRYTVEENRPVWLTSTTERIGYFGTETADEVCTMTIEVSHKDRATTTTTRPCKDDEK